MNPVHKINLILSLRLRICLPRDRLHSGFHSRNLYGFLSNACYMTTYDFITVIKLPLPMARQPLVGQGLLTVEVSRSHSDTQQSVELPWMDDQPDRDLYLTTHNTFKRKTSLSSTGFKPAIPA